MSRFLKTTAANPGDFSVRMEASPDVPGDSVYYIDLGDEPVEVSDGDAQHILNTYPGKVEEVFRAAAVAETTEEEKAKSFFDRFRS